MTIQQVRFYGRLSVMELHIRHSKELPLQIEE
jgi:hypothetical protein